MRILRTVARSVAVAALLVACTKPPPIVAVPAAPPEALLIQNVAVLDVETGMSAPGQDVLVRDGRIARIAASGTVDTPAEAAKLDGRGATLLPGLVDMHAHVGSPVGPPWVLAFPDEETNLQGFLYSGVTTVLDLGSLAPDGFERRESIARGELLGPRTFDAGPIVTVTDGHPVAIFRQSLPTLLAWYVLPRMTREVGNAEEARAAAAEIAGMGADVLKVAVDRIPESAPRIPNDSLRAAVAEAKKHDLRSVAHIGSAQDAIDAGDAGVAAWVHGVTKDRLTDEQVAKLAGYGIPMVPTMVVFESFGALGDPHTPSALERESVPPDALAAMNQVPDGFDLTGPRSLAGRLGDTRDNVRRLHAAGVTILAGSDFQGGLFAGASLHDEIRLLTEAGLTNAEAIRAATLDPARFLSKSDDPDFGIVKEGARADFLLVEGDPVADIGNLSRIRNVVKGGVVIERTPRTKS